LTNFSFLRNLHNSLSRSSERADLDIALMEAANAKRGTKSAEKEGDEMFHFIAYVPVNGVLWELDGLRRQPVRLGFVLLYIKLTKGNCENGQWLQLATPRIQGRMERYFYNWKLLM
jgi:ubiquitin carboxyl-terminal hydrolase L5